MAPQLTRFVRQLVAEFQNRPKWEPVRLVNQEGVSYGDQVASYTNMFAELILRILRQKSIDEPDANISIQAFGTTFMRGGYHSTKPQEYLNRVFEYLKFLAVRRGLAVTSGKWTLEKLALNFGRDRAELVICDILSNASHDDFVRLDYREPRRRTDTSTLLITAFGDHNWTLAVRELFERVSVLVEEYSFGMAIIAIAERLCDEVSTGDYDASFLGKAREAIDSIVGHLATMGARGRDPQLSSVLNWLDQIIGHQRLLDRGYRLARWLLTNVTQPLREQLNDEKERETVDWFEYGVHRWALTAANHQGKLFDAQIEVEAMRAIAQRLAHQWERAPILFDGLIAQAVHLSDEFEFARVSKDMRLVADSLATQSALFSTYLSDEFPDPIKFDVQAKAIGTLVQNEILKGFTDADHLDKTRSLSDTAINEFVEPRDKARQFQYRCHLETIAGDFAAARRYLIWSIRKAQTEESDFSHAAIWRLLAASNDDPRWQRDFTASHWLRLGAKTCLKDDLESEDFIEAIDSSGLLEFYGGSSALVDYPAHNIFRSIAVIHASSRRADSALSALNRLHELDPIGKAQFSLAMVLLAAQAEVAGLLMQSDPAKARSLLHDMSGPPVGLMHLFTRMRAASADKLPRIAELLNSWEAEVDALVIRDVATENAKQILLGIGSDVRY